MEMRLRSGWGDAPGLAAPPPGAHGVAPLAVLLFLLYFSTGSVQLPLFPIIALPVAQGGLDLGGFGLAVVGTGAAIASVVSTPLIRRLEGRVGGRAELLRLALTLAAVLAAVLGVRVDGWVRTASWAAPAPGHFRLVATVEIAVLFSTYSLLNSVAIATLTALAIESLGDRGALWGRLRAFGTLGFLLACVVVGSLPRPPSRDPFCLGAAAYITSGLLCLGRFPSGASAAGRSNRDPVRWAELWAVARATGLSGLMATVILCSLLADLRPEHHGVPERAACFPFAHDGPGDRLGHGDRPPTCLAGLLEAGPRHLSPLALPRGVRRGLLEFRGRAWPRLGAPPVLRCPLGGLQLRALDDLQPNRKPSRRAGAAGGRAVGSGFVASRRDARRLDPVRRHRVGVRPAGRTRLGPLLGHLGRPGRRGDPRRPPHRGRDKLGRLPSAGARSRRWAVGRGDRRHPRWRISRWSTCRRPGRFSGELRVSFVNSRRGSEPSSRSHPRLNYYVQ